MHKLSSAILAAAVGPLSAGCATGDLPDIQAASVSKAANLVFEQVCIPVVLDGADFATVAKARLMTPMAPAVSGNLTAQTFRLGHIGVTASMWQDGSCAVGVERGDSEHLRDQTIASLRTRGQDLKPGVAGLPAANDGVGAVYCSTDPRPVMLGVTMPASTSAKTHAMIATLYPAADKPPALCTPG
jgi:hypothetical protein